jgi:hypothetical protein
LKRTIEVGTNRFARGTIRKNCIRRHYSLFRGISGVDTSMA